MEKIVWELGTTESQIASSVNSGDHFTANQEYIIEKGHLKIRYASFKRESPQELHNFSLNTLACLI